MLESKIYENLSKMSTEFTGLLIFSILKCENINQNTLPDPLLFSRSQLALNCLNEFLITLLCIEVVASVKCEYFLNLLTC